MKSLGGPPSPDRGRRILYFDDQEPLVFVITHLLEQQGYRVSGYTDPAEGIEALRLDPLAFDLVVSDYHMPDMSGLDVARRVREIRADLPVALVSGFLDATLWAEAKEAGVKELIFKTNTISDLSAAVRRLLPPADEPGSF